MSLLRFSPILIIAALGILAAVGGAFFVVPQTHQAIVLRFGELVQTHTDPGLKFKIPFIDQAQLYERRILDYDLPPVPLTTGNRKRVVVDVYCRYRIADPAVFFKSVKPSTEAGIRQRLDALVGSSVRNVLGRVDLSDLLSEKRSKIMLEIEEAVRKMSEPLGLKIVEIRMIRAELPLENRKAVYNVMEASLNRLAQENRAKGNEEAQAITAKADRDRTVMLAEANKNAEIVKAEGKAKAMEIVGKALSQATKLFEATESLRIFRENLKDSQLILSFDNDLFKYFGHTKD